MRCRAVRGILSPCSNVNASPEFGIRQCRRQRLVEFVADLDIDTTGIAGVELNLSRRQCYERECLAWEHGIRRVEGLNLQ